MRHKGILIAILLLVVGVAGQYIAIELNAKSAEEQTSVDAIKEQTMAINEGTIIVESYYCNRGQEVLRTEEEPKEESYINDEIDEAFYHHEMEREAIVATFASGKTDIDVEEIDIFYIEEEQTEYYCVQVLEILATGYCVCEKCCCKAHDDPEYGITASGFDVFSVADPRIVAADTSILPFGTKIYIEVPEMSRDTKYVTEDFGIATVEDRGGAIKGARIDVFFPSHQEALEWGRRNVNVYVLAPLS